MKGKIIILAALLTAAFSTTAFATSVSPMETLPMADTSTESLPASEPIEETLPPGDIEPGVEETSENGEEVIEGSEESLEEGTIGSGTGEYGNIQIVTIFDEDVDQSQFGGYRVILTPANLEPYYDSGQIPEDLQLPNTVEANDESYEVYEYAISGINEFKAEADIRGLRAINIQCTQSNIMAQDKYYYIPYGDEVYTIDMGELDKAGFYVGESYFIRNEPGSTKTIYIMVSNNPNPKKPDINSVEISDEIKQIVRQANGETESIGDQEINTIVDDKYIDDRTDLEKAAPVFIVMAIVAGIVVGGVLVIRKIRKSAEEDDD